MREIALILTIPGTTSLSVKMPVRSDDIFSVIRTIGQMFASGFIDIAISDVSSLKCSLLHSSLSAVAACVVGVKERQLKNVPPITNARRNKMECCVEAVRLFI